MASLSHRNYRLFFFGQLVSQAGTWMQTVAQSFQVLGLTHSGTQLGLTTAARFLPVLLFGQVGGLFADRADKRRVLYVTQASAGLLAAAFAVLTGTHEMRLWTVYVLAVALGFVNVFDNPARQNVDDVAFIKSLVAAVDPGHRHPIYVVGYSNGGRLAYTLACSAPGLFDGTAVVKADPDPGCVVSRPLTILQIAALDDTAVPYTPGDKGRESPPATVQVAALRKVDGCSGSPAETPHSAMTLTTWADCSSGARVGFAVWNTGGHGFPWPQGSTPSAAQVIWSFFTKTALAPLPK